MKTWQHFVEVILRKAAAAFPDNQTYHQLIRCDEHWNEFAEPIKTAMVYVTHHNLIVELGTGNKVFRISTMGQTVLETGVQKFISEKAAQDEADKSIKHLSLSLLQEQIIEIKRKNKYWRIAIIAGAIGFILSVLQAFKVI